MSGPIQLESALGLIRARLISVAAVTDLVSNRISGAWPESTDLGTIPRPCIVYRLAEGDGIYARVIADLQVEIWALSAISLSEARTVHDALYEALQAEGLSVDGLDHRGLIRTLPGTKEGHWEKGNSWYVASRWRLTVVRDN